LPNLIFHFIEDHNMSHTGDGLARPIGGDPKVGASRLEGSDLEAVRVLKNDVAATSLMSSLVESWEEGGLTVASALRPEPDVGGQPTSGASDSFLKAVKETVLLVQNYFPHSGGSSWPSVAEVVLECFVAADQIYGEDRANKFAENHSWTEEQLKSDLTAYQESGYDIGAMVALRHQKNNDSGACREAQKGQPRDRAPDESLHRNDSTAAPELQAKRAL
jgi:hypothetical protein